MELRILKTLFPLLILSLSSCTKEVNIDIPGYEEKLVIDGRIETGQPPVVLISTSKEVYAPTDLDAFMNGFISGAVVTLSDGTNSIQLDEICSDDLPPGTEEMAATLLGIPAENLANYSICAYTTFDTNFWGEVGKTYTLTVTYDGQSYSAATKILPPTPLNKTFWKADDNLTEHGFSWAELSDPPGVFDAYFWEVRRLNGPESDFNFKPTYSPVTDDEFFDGLTFEFWYENPYGNDMADSVRWMYAKGDTVIIKMSKIDRDVFDFYEKKYMQLQTAGNPFASPTSIVSNFSNGALGLWAGFSPSFDTLVCQP
jgi:hypothetical protein